MSYHQGAKGLNLRNMLSFGVKFRQFKDKWVQFKDSILQKCKQHPTFLTLS